MFFDFVQKAEFSGIGDIKIEEISKGIIPCLVAELLVLLLCTYVPFVSTMFVS